MNDELERWNERVRELRAQLLADTERLRAVEARLARARDNVKWCAVEVGKHRHALEELTDALARARAKTAGVKPGER